MDPSTLYVRCCDPYGTILLVFLSHDSESKCIPGVGICMKSMV